MADRKRSKPKLSPQEKAPASPSPKKAAPKTGSAGRDASQKAICKSRRPVRAKAARGITAIVGIGASAGGLEALQGLIGNLPLDSGLAFVVIQHLPPGHKSIMGTLLARSTTMPIEEIRDGLKIVPNHIYLHPADNEVTLMKSVFYLTAAHIPHLSRLPIDHFFRSLAEDQQERAVCIVLSGTGSDGTQGLKAVKGEGGLTMAQVEKQAHYASMPRSAIGTGMVDRVLPVEEMGGELAKYIRHPFLTGRQTPPAHSKRIDTYIQKIFLAIRSRTGKDFSDYKQNTIRRRIERRMAVHQIDDIASYVRHLQGDADEVESLAQDMLIGVTSFFRDPEAFDALKEKILIPLVKGRSPDSDLRIWVPGCSNGEEAYSIAILLQEVMESMKNPVNIQIFATDIDARAVAFARAGVYPESVAADVTQDRLRTFFTRADNQLSVKKKIREMVVFAEQNLIKDPPFSHLDLVSCRNLMIYLNAALQKKVLALFHYVLNNEGILFLGTSESIGAFADYFAPVNQKWKIFRRKGFVSPRDFEYQEPLYMKEPAGLVKKPTGARPAGEQGIREMAERIILTDYAPPCVLVNEHLEIVYFHGDTKPYLSPPVGKATFDLLKMAHEGLHLQLSNALHKSRARKRPVSESISFQDGGDIRSLRLLVRPLERPAGLSGLTMVVFETAEETAKKITTGKKTKEGATQESHRIAVMEQELQSTREYLQTTNEELETSNEELKSTNEELQSTNEELQSTNEELETSKEELQSTNEELETVNSELQGKVNELTRANNDLGNIMASTEIATIFLDKRFTITRFTPPMADIFNLIRSDIGRPISDITSSVGELNLVPFAVKVLETLIPEEAEITTADREVYKMRVMPYRTMDDVIDGVVVTFVDVTALKDMESERRLAAVVKDSNDAISVQKLDGTITAWNRGAERLYGYTEKEAIGMKISNIVPSGKKREALDIVRRIRKGEDIPSLETRRLAKDGRMIDVWVTVTKLTDQEGQAVAIATTERDLRVFKERDQKRGGA